jgi:signal transduction histidine kinase
VNRADELGDLARALAEMAGEIERWRTDLERRVDEKTRELREMQELLLRAQKLAAVSQLGAGVAHEINNPLTGLLGITQILRAEAPVGSKQRDRLERVESQAQRIREIVENLRRMADGGERLTLTSIDVHTLLDGAVALDQPQLDEQRIQVTRRYDEASPPVAGDAAQLTEAFFQLITNARRAMKQGGRLTLATRRIEGRLVAVEVADTGEGMPPEMRDRIFDPFFTTKRDWHAKGLGLTQVNNIVDGHGGRITVQSELGVGSTFTVVLPAARARTLA